MTSKIIDFTKLKKAIEKEYWHCTYCHFDNDADNIECDGCGEFDSSCTPIVKKPKQEVIKQFLA